MKIYFKETNGNNQLFITDGNRVKIFYGEVENINLDSKNVVERLRKKI